MRAEWHESRDGLRAERAWEQRWHESSYRVGTWGISSLISAVLSYQVEGKETIA
jgi:hypothetical protein